MKIAIDLHIHSALSPCGDEDMTPNNIINMCLLKGLDAIAITDHNSVENCEACMEAAQNRGIVVIPGMEIQTKEEVHMLCLFQDLFSAYAFQEIVYERLGKENNLPDLFGRQMVYDSKDQMVRENIRRLITSANITIKEVIKELDRFHGVAVPAHVDKGAYSIIANLGFIPPDMSIATLEISKKADVASLLAKYKYLEQYRLIRNSDAHYLWDILERESFIEVQEKSVEGILTVLKKNPLEA